MKYKVTLNGKVYEIEVEQGNAMLVDEYAAIAPVTPAPAAASSAPSAAPTSAPTPSAAAPASAPVQGGKAITAPMPGTIVDVKVAVGASVAEGQLVAILEAMKMENEIFASAAGTVVQINAAKGTSVDTGSAIVTLS